jgi:hypothetical protein
LSEIDGEKSFERLLASFLREDLAPAGLGCPAPGVAAAYYEGKLSQAEARHFEQHLAGCGGCQAQIAALVRLEPSPQERETVTPPVELPDQSGKPPVEEILEEEPPVEEAPPPQARLLVDPIPPAIEESVPTEVEIEPGAAPEGAMPFKPGRRRSSWRWVGPVAFGAAAVVAVSVTLRFAPMVEEASRKARESDVAPPPSAPTSAPVASGEGEREGNQAQMKDERTTQDRLWQSEPPAPLDNVAPMAPSQRSADVAAAPTQARPQAPLPTAQPAPPAAAGGRAAERLAPKAAPQPLEEAKKEDSREKALMERSAIAAAAKTAATPTAATPVRAERRRDSGPIVVVARTNLDAAWRLSGNGIDRSDDAGKTWRPQMSFTAAALLTGSAPSAQICWVAGQGGVVLRTTDGEHWERVISPTQDDLVQITAWNASSATIKSASGARFSTNDGGQTWSRL